MHSPFHTAFSSREYCVVILRLYRSYRGGIGVQFCSASDPPAEVVTQPPSEARQPLCQRLSGITDSMMTTFPCSCGTGKSSSCYLSFRLFVTIPPGNQCPSPAPRASQLIREKKKIHLQCLFSPSTIVL